MKKILKPTCPECGTEQQPDEEMSNENWQVYKTGEKCPNCGTEFPMVSIADMMDV